MTSSRTEIEGLGKRITQLEETIGKLKDEDLLVAKRIAVALCTLDFNMDLRVFKGEEHESFKKLWEPKLEATKTKIESAQTSKEVIEITFMFDEELTAYTTATKVDTADKAMEVAHSFIKKYSPVALPLKAVKEGDVWLVDIDVGALAVKVAKIKVDARTGDILSYDIPEKK